MSDLFGRSKDRPSSTTQPGANDGPAPAPLEPVPDESCGTCHFGGLNPQALEVVECRGLPPTPVVVGMSPQGPAITLLYANLPRKTAACALWRRRKSIIIGKA